MTDPSRRVAAAVARIVRSASPRARRASGTRIPPGMLGVTIVDDAPGNTRSLDRIFDAFDNTVRDFPDVLKAAVPTIREAHRNTFANEGAAGRGRWAPLAPATLVDRARRGYGPGPILERTGALKAHVLAAPVKITRRGRDVTMTIRPDDNVDGVPKYRALARGTDKIPARPMVMLGKSDANRVTSVIARELRARARARGLR